MAGSAEGANGSGEGRIGSQISSLRQADARIVGLIAFAVAATGSVVYVLLVGRGQTLILDEWSYLTESQEWSIMTLITPHNGHLILLPTLVLRGMYSIFGISSHLPYQILTVSLNVLIAGLLYAFARKRLGPLVALAPAILILFYGAGWDAFMTAYQLPNLLGLAAGLAALLAVEREDLRGDVLACLLLALSLASFSVGIAFAAGLAVALLLRGREIAIRRAWVVVAPGLLYGAWLIWASKFHETHVTAYNVGALFTGMLDQLGAALVGITGLFTTPGTTELATMISVRSDWAPVLVAAVSIVSALALRRKHPTASLSVVLTVLFVYLALVALSLGPAREPAASRFVYLASVLTLLALAEIARGVTLSRRGAVGLTMALFLSLLANAAVLAAGGRLVRLEGATNRAQLGALEIARGSVASDLTLESAEVTTMSNPDMLFDASAYFKLAGSYGSPAYSEAEIEGTGEQAKGAADQLLARALPISVQSGFRSRPKKHLSTSEGPFSATVASRRGCLLLRPDRGDEGRVVVEVPHGGMALRSAGASPPSIKLRRFATAFDVIPVVPFRSMRLLIPTDSSPLPWIAEVTSSDPVLLCA